MLKESITCQTVRETLLEQDWTAVQRDRMLAFLIHAGECPSCRAALAEFDYVRSVMQPPAESPEPSTGWRQFEQELERQIGGRPRLSRRWQTFALAASLMLAAVGWGLYGRGLRSAPSLPGRGPHDDLASLQISSQEAQQQVRIFSEVAKAFDERTAWVLLNDRQTDMGLAAAPVKPIRKLLLLRLTVLKAAAVVSSANLVVVPDQTAELDMPFERGQQLHYVVGTSDSDPLGLSMWAEVRRPNGSHEALAALATSLQAQPNKVLDAGQLVTSTGEYQFKIAYSQAAWPETRP